MDDATAARALRKTAGTVARAGLIGLAVIHVAGCSESLPSMPRLTDLNPFAEKQVPLPGKRVPIELNDKTGSISLSPAEKPVALPPMVQNDAWSQPGGAASNVLGHLTLSAAPKLVWSADIGQASTTRGRLIAGPIVAEGRVFAIDAAGLVTSFAASGGSAQWRTSTAPDYDKSIKGFGGGLAFEGGRLFAANGYGIVTAIDPASGKKLWDKAIGVPVRAAPTVANGRIFVLATDGRTVALSGADGSELWVHRGIPERASIVASVSPAVEGDVLLVPYPSGELVALNAASGQPMWTESLARTRIASSLTSMSDAARPAVERGIVFAVGHAGRMVASSARNGERIWTINVPSIQGPWVAGEGVYVVDTGGQLMAITRSDGRALWSVRLPGATIWSGPVLAGGRLWVVSDKGMLVGVDAATGRVEHQQNVGAAVYIPPIVAGGRLYLLTDRGRLMAYQ